MKKNRFRIFLILAFIVLSGYFLLPTINDLNHQQKLKSLTGKEKDSLAYYSSNEKSIRENRAKRLKLGLDLQGGMYVTMEVDVEQLLEKMAKKKDDQLTQILNETKKEAQTSEESVLDIFGRKFDRLGLRLSRYYGDMRDDNARIIAMLKDETDKAVDRAVKIIQNRIDQYGVSETTIQRSGPRRIVLELPGVSDEKEVRSLIQETAQLEFKLFPDPKHAQEALDRIDRVLLGKSLVDSTAAADSTKRDSTAVAQAKTDTTKSAKDTARKSDKQQTKEELAKEHPFMALFVSTQQFGMMASEDEKAQITSLLKRPDVQKAIPADLQMAWQNQPEVIQNQKYYPFYILKATPELTGEVITNARAQTDQQGFGGAVVTMQMNSEGGREWARITGANVNKRIAIVLDGVVYSAPNVKQKIIGGNSEISGMANMEEARLLEIVLKAGALPAPVEIIEERTVGPSLGEDSINKGFWSFVIGVAFVLVFMVVYYTSGGIPANVAVLFNVLFILGILAGFNATLTLPGIAGILLTVGMAVDANVLINERVREELAAGKTMRAAIDSGYARAMSAIIDSNVTTIITALVLYQFGSGPIQGFALTLTIGLICSMFTAIVMTRVFFEITLDVKPGIVKFG